MRLGSHPQCPWVKAGPPTTWWAAQETTQVLWPKKRGGWKEVEGHTHRCGKTVTFTAPQDSRNLAKLPLRKHPHHTP